MFDFAFEFYGSVALLHPQSMQADDWIADNVAPDVMRWGRAIAIEHSAVSDVLAAIADAGLRVH